MHTQVPQDMARTGRYQVQEDALRRKYVCQARKNQKMGPACMHACIHSRHKISNECTSKSKTQRGNEGSTDIHEYYTNFLAKQIGHSAVLTPESIRSRWEQRDGDRSYERSSALDGSEVESRKQARIRIQCEGHEIFDSTRHPSLTKRKICTPKGTIRYS